VQLLAESQEANVVVELIPVVGDFVGKDESLFALYGNVSGIDENILLSSINFGVERTLEQDPTFAFRIILDIALKALSPAINDPTTAVLAIDQIHSLLRSAGKRNLRTDNITDESGKLRVIFRTPNWEDFVTLACTELRRYGADSIQVVRRLRAMIENLIRTCPKIVMLPFRPSWLCSITQSKLYTVSRRNWLSHGQRIHRALAGHRFEKKAANVIRQRGYWMDFVDVFAATLPTLRFDMSAYFLFQLCRTGFS
jgi:hypothetical protein